MRDEIWVKHDVRSRVDPKMARFIKICGMAGYGAFWAIIEILHYQNEHEICWETEFEGVADQIGCSLDILMPMVEQMVTIGLLKLEEGKLFQEKLKQNQAERSSARSATSATKVLAGKIGGLSKSARNKGLNEEQTQAFIAERLAGGVAGLAYAIDKKDKKDKKDIDMMLVEPSKTLPAEITLKQPLEEIEQTKIKVEGKRGTWPPPGDELKPNVFLTTDQTIALREKMGQPELEYWLNALSDYAKDHLQKWKRNYKDHSRVIFKWREKELQKNLIWNDEVNGYRYPPKNSQVQIENPNWKKEWYAEQRQRIAREIAEAENRGRNT